MPRMTGKHAVMQMLRAEGVEYIFGNPGTTETPLMDALEDYPEIKYMLTVQEGVAMGSRRPFGQPGWPKGDKMVPKLMPNGEQNGAHIGRNPKTENCVWTSQA